MTMTQDRAPAVGMKRNRRRKKECGCWRKNARKVGIRIAVTRSEHECCFFCTRGSRYRVEENLINALRLEIEESVRLSTGS